MNYHQYIRSPEWKRRRDAKVKAAGCKCEHCSFHTHLQVHHLSYSKLGNEPLNHLMVLCERCHKLIEAHMQAVAGNRPKGSIKGLKNFTHKYLKRYGVPQIGDQPLDKRSKKIRAKKYDPKKALVAFRKHRTECRTRSMP